MWRAPICVWCMCCGACVVFVWSDFDVVCVRMVCVKCVCSVGFVCGVCDVLVVCVFLCM